MMSRRLIFTTSLLATAILFFTLGAVHSRREAAASRASYDAKLDAIRSEVQSQLGTAARGQGVMAGTSGRLAKSDAAAARAGRASMMKEIKEQLQTEMGLLPVHLLRDRRTSFVELYSYDNLGKTNYGTAGYLGGGY